MVVNPLAAVLPLGDQLPHLRARMVSPRTDPPPPAQPPPQVRRTEGKGVCGVDTSRAGGTDNVTLVRWVRGPRRVFVGEDLLRYGMYYLPSSLPLSVCGGVVMRC